MSTKHVRRYREQEQITGQQNLKDEEEEEEEDEKKVSPVRNRFALFDDPIDSPEKEEDNDEQSSTALPTKPKKGRRKQKKRDRTGPGEEDEEDGKRELVESTGTQSDKKQISLLGVVDLFRIDGRLLHAENELKRLMGRAYPVDSSAAKSHRRFATGRLVRRSRNWPEPKNIGLSMSKVDQADGTRSFVLVHNSSYQDLQRMFWHAIDSMNHDLIANILREYPYHLDSLLQMADIMRMQEDYQTSRDLIERALFCCEHVMHPLFQFGGAARNQLFDYEHWENRAFFLVLHRHMLNLVSRKCYRTALEFAKLIYCLDPEQDPLAILLQIDVLCLQSRQYEYLDNFFRLLRNSKKLDQLPNFAYSIAIAHFLQSQEKHDNEGRAMATEMLSDALMHFPSVLLAMLNKISVQPDPDVEKSALFSRTTGEGDGLKLLIRLYVELSHEMWREPMVLQWLEATVRTLISDLASSSGQMGERRAQTIREYTAMYIPRQFDRVLVVLRRERNFKGTPKALQRAAALHGLVAVDTLVDPVPPTNSIAAYRRPPPTPLPDSFLSGLIHSLIPEYNQDRPLGNSVEEMIAAVRQMFAQRNDAEPEDEEGEEEEEGQ